MNPAEEAVVRFALGRGYFNETHLAQARHEQAARRQRGQPADLLPLLAAYLSPPQVEELRQVYLSATQSGLRSPTVHPSQVGQSTQPGLGPPQPASHARLHPSSASGRIPLDPLPDSGEKTIQLSGPTPDGITHSFIPPGAAVGPPGSVHLGAPAYPPQPGSYHPGSQHPGSYHPGSHPGSYHPGSQHPGSQHPGTVAVPPAYGPGPAAAFGSTSALGSGVSSPASRPTQLPVAGDRIGDYTLVRELARGGMGVVYEATDINLGRRVALKLLLSQDLTDDNVLVRRFLTEARELSNLSHPNIAGVYGASRDMNGRHYMAMEFLEGEELKAEIVRDGFIEPTRAAEIVLKLAQALSHAHGAGVLHRDIKPSNVIVTEAGEPKLVDFGLARNVEDERERLTKTGEIMGTPAYMPPEQAGGEKSRVGPLADVYSLGATLYHMLAGQPPFRGTSVMNLINKVLSEEPAPPSSHNDGIPKPLEAICLKAMEKELEDRYESAAAFAEDLERFLGPRGEVSAKARGPLGRALRWASRKGAIFVGGGLALVGVGLAAAAVLLSSTPIEAPTPTPSPTQSATPTPKPTRTQHTALVINPGTLADLQGLQVRGGWALGLDDRIRLRATRGIGPELSLPFTLRKSSLDIEIKGQVEFMSYGAGVCFELVPIRDIHQNGRPGGPAKLRLEFTSREDKAAFAVEHGFRVNWSDLNDVMRRPDDALEFGFREFPEAGPIPLEFTIQVREDRVILVWGKRRKDFQVQIRTGRSYRLDIRPTPNRYEKVRNGEDQTQAGHFVMRGLTRPPQYPLSPEVSSLSLEEIRLVAPGSGSLAVLEETHQWAQISALERQAILRENLGPLMSKTKDLTGGTAGNQSNSRVRNEAGCFGAALHAWAGKVEEGGQALRGLYDLNAVPPRRTSVFQEWGPCLDETTLSVFVLGYRHKVMSQLPDDQPQAFLTRGAAPFRGEAIRTKPLRLHVAVDALNCLLIAKRLGVKVDPLVLGRAWLEIGDPVRAHALLSPLAEKGDRVAMAYAGLAAYLLRKFKVAESFWRRLEEGPVKLPQSWRWAAARAQRLAK